MMRALRIAIAGAALALAMGAHAQVVTSGTISGISALTVSGSTTTTSIQSSAYTSFSSGAGVPVSDPPTAPTLVDNGAGSMGAGTYQYAYLERRNGNTAFSPVASITIAASRAVMVTLPSIRRGATSRALYRTRAGGSTYYLAHDFGGDLGYHQNKFLDNQLDAAITQTITGNGATNNTAAVNLLVSKGVKYWMTNPDDSALFGDGVHADVTVLTSNGDDASLAYDFYSGVYARTRSKANYSSAKVGQAGTTSNHFVAFSVNDDGADPVITTVYQVIADGWTSIGQKVSGPATSLDVTNLVTARTSFTGLSLMPLAVRGYNGNGNYSGIDFINGEANNYPDGRIGLLHTASGSFLQFGTSATYASGITNGLTAIDYNGRLGVGNGVTAAYGGLLNTKADGTGVPLIRNLDASGYVRQELLSTGFSKWYISDETTPLNYSRGNISASATYFKISSEKAGSGATINMRVSSDGILILGSGNQADRWYLDSSGHLLLINNAANDIGSTSSGLRHIFRTGYSEVIEMTAPAAPAADRARIYAKDNGSGKTQLCALFSTGIEQCFATQP